MSFAGHCFLMQDLLQQAYAAYQNAISYLVNRKVRGAHLALTLARQ